MRELRYRKTFLLERLPAKYEDAINNSVHENFLPGQFKNLGVLLAGEEIIIASLAIFLYEIMTHFSETSIPADPGKFQHFLKARL